MIMADYLLTNIIISFIALTGLYLLKNAPARMRFYVAIMSLLAWFVPWHLLSSVSTFSELITPVTDEVFHSLVWLDSSGQLLAENTTQLAAQPTAPVFDMLANLLTATTLLFCASIIGLLFFTQDVVNYYRHIKRWNSHSFKANNLWHEHGFTCHNIDIRVLDEGGPGMATGLIKPTIWLNKNYLNCTTSKTIITHELNHIVQHDPAWMWIITFSRRLFWWNPLVHIIANSAQQQIELSCDEKCSQQLNNQYAYDLAEILLHNDHAPNKYMLAVTIKNSKNFNIKRIEKLTKESNMKRKYLVVLLGAFSMTSFVGLAVNYDKSPATENTTQVLSKQNQPQKIKIYREDTLHNELVDELLHITQQAKSSDHHVLSQILINTKKWHLNRKTSSDHRSEKHLKLLSFTMMAYLLNELQRYAEIPAAYDKMYPNKPIEKELFLKHHVALAYIKMGIPNQAIELMADVPQRQPKPKMGTLILIAHAHLAAHDYDAVITTAGKIAGSSNSKFTKITALNFKREAYLKMANTDKVDEINNILKESYQVTAGTPRLLIPGSPILQYLPEAG